MKRYGQAILFICGSVLCWQALITVQHIPAYFLPSPMAVLKAMWHNRQVIATAAGVSIVEMLVGFGLACLFAVWAAVSLVYCRVLRVLVWPILVLSQALPTFAVAPLLVLWLGYGLSSKIVITLWMLFFPIMSAFLDGLLMPRPDLLAMAQLMTDSRWRILWHIQIPGALPKLASGLRVAAAGAPLATIMGEWVGSSQGLGYLLLEANARLQMDLVFALLLVLVFWSLLLYFSVDAILKRWITW